ALMHIGLPGTTGIRKRGRKKLVDDLLVPFLAFPRFPYRPHYVDDDQPGECRTTAFHVQIPPVTACDQVISQLPSRVRRNSVNGRTKQWSPGEPALTHGFLVHTTCRDNILSSVTALLPLVRKRMFDRY